MFASPFFACHAVFPDMRHLEMRVIVSSPWDCHRHDLSVLIERRACWLRHPFIFSHSLLLFLHFLTGLLNVVTAHSNFGFLPFSLDVVDVGPLFQARIYFDFLAQFFIQSLIEWTGGRVGIWRRQILDNFDVVVHVETSLSDIPRLSIFQHRFSMVILEGLVLDDVPRNITVGVVVINHFGLKRLRHTLGLK